MKIFVVISVIAMFVISCKSQEKKNSNTPPQIIGNILEKEPVQEEEKEYLFPVLPMREGYYNPGDKLIAMAPEGMTDRDLGTIVALDFERKISAPIKGKRFSDPINSYSAEGKICETEQEIAANANVMTGLLNFGINSKDVKNRVYSWKSYAYKDHAEQFILTKKPPVMDGYIITRIFYGWSLNHVLSGTAQYYDEGLDAQIGNSIPFGGANAQASFRRYSNSSNVQWRISARGFVQKSPNEYLADTPEAVESKYKTGEPRPIWVEYTVLDYTKKGELDYDRTYGTYSLTISKICVTDEWPEDYADITVQLAPFSTKYNAQHNANCVGLEKPIIFQYAEGQLPEIIIYDRDPNLFGGKTYEQITSAFLPVEHGEQRIDFPDGSTMRYFLERIGPLDP